MPTEVTTSATRCRPSASSTGERRRRPVRSSSHDQAPLSIVATAFRPMPSTGMLERVRIAPGDPGLVEDRQRGDDDQHALDDGGEELGLVVAIGMVGVGRNGGEVQGAEGQQAGRDVHRAFQRIGIQRDAAGDPPGGALQPSTRQPMPMLPIAMRSPRATLPGPLLCRPALANPRGRRQPGDL